MLIPFSLLSPVAWVGSVSAFWALNTLNTLCALNALPTLNALWTFQWTFNSEHYVKGVLRPDYYDPATGVAVHRSW
jgi:hypothetical protein